MQGANRARRMTCSPCPGPSTFPQEFASPAHAVVTAATTPPSGAPFIVLESKETRRLFALFFFLLTCRLSISLSLSHSLLFSFVVDFSTTFIVTFSVERSKSSVISATAHCARTDGFVADRVASQKVAHNRLYARVCVCKSFVQSLISFFFVEHILI